MDGVGWTSLEVLEPWGHGNAPGFLDVAVGHQGLSRLSQRRPRGQGIWLGGRTHSLVLTSGRECREYGGYY